MGKSLVIVESPAKAKTINKYLGKDFVVKSSVGHIRDLPTSSTLSTKAEPAKNGKKTGEIKATKRLKADPKDALVRRMGVDPYNDWRANYQILPGKEKVVSELQALAKNADHVFLATDLDREGEAIAWHLQEIIGGDSSRFSRVVFNEITENAIKQAFDNPSEVNLQRVNAQQARRFMDRVVGYMVSPLLWKKVARGLSAGRVQSVAVRLIVEREHEIKAFIPEEFWRIHVDVLTKSKEQQVLKVEVHTKNGSAFRPVSSQEAMIAVSELESAKFVVSEREAKPTQSKPSAPFITSTLQQAASTRLSFGVKKTMMLAQRLYEAGHITYMRTDSTNLSADALVMARDYILKYYGDAYLPSSPNHYSNKDNSQEAHEAIRPSDVNVLSEMLNDMEPDAKRLYQLIWSQFLACQMTPAKYDSTLISISAGEYILKAKGRTLKFDGWTKVLNAIRKNEEDKTLPLVNVGDELPLGEIFPEQHFTKPPARFSEASLVKELEKRGIGRPSTYASIISTIQDRGYVRVENRRFYAEKMGEIVVDRLESSFKDLMSYDFTANMENNLDKIAKDEANWKKILDIFFADFTKQLETAEKDVEEGGMLPNSVVLTAIDCPLCNRKMGIRTGSTGVFLGCSGYSLTPKERCKSTINLIPEVEVLNILEGEDAETKALLARKRCPKCSTAMDSYLIDPKRKLHVCGNNPNCEGYELEIGEFRIKGYEGPIVECEKCSSEMHLKSGRFGKYMGCTNDDCKNTRKILRNGEVAPPKEDPIPLPELECEKSDAYFVLRDGAAGVFLAAHNFPKSRETRAPYVDELKRFEDRLPDKLHYLSTAPLTDDEGNRTFVRYSRKTKQQYVSSEKDGKPTSWSRYYVDGKWINPKD
ncbi:type I DNA topoisomerase [Thorsellia anophelis]|uniref:DNA topoisomerase 1 n=1 Tax=Thorsellia anophelis DSM 18579 TaxID=1123402 RepID=A0A1H9ZPM8_9GAMM|nr:type I DNA topoisomerase [Thorsellia anophelis]SES83167.1 DNA topoisomerase-1 [Thorsellia anophelis DSM 18579]